MMSQVSPQPVGRNNRSTTFTEGKIAFNYHKSPKEEAFYQIKEAIRNKGRPHHFN